jgi:hypothetical protein
MRFRPHAMLAAAAAAALAAGTALAADYAGTFRGDIKGQPASVELSPSGDGYAGTIRVGDAALPCKATESGGQLSGTFTSAGDTFGFTATLAGNTLNLRTGGASYAMARRGNPLGGSGAAAAADAPGSVTATVLASTRTGRTLFLTLPAARTAADALQATVPLLRSAVGGPVRVTGGFANGRTGTQGGASFTGTDGQGRPVRGTVLCGGGADGEAVTFLYATADATAADWAALRAVLPRQPLKLTTYRFPDGTGTFAMPEGWTTKQTTLDDGITITGPAGQTVIFGLKYDVFSPDSVVVQSILQTEAMARQVGVPPNPRPESLLIAPFAGPADTITALMPQFDAFARRHLNCGLRLGRIIEDREMPAIVPGGRAAQVTYTVIKTTADGEQKLRGIAQAECREIMAGQWAYYASEISSPDATFDDDVITMDAVLRSVRPDPEVMMQHYQAKLAAQQQVNQQEHDAQVSQFDALQKAHREQQDGFDRANKGWEERQLVGSRCNDNACEVIRGYRTVADTQLGTSAQVDLTSARAVADALNEQCGDPTRFVPIPLRDELHPLNR